MFTGPLIIDFATDVYETKLDCDVMHGYHVTIIQRSKLEASVTSQVTIATKDFLVIAVMAVHLLVQEPSLNTHLPSNIFRLFYAGSLQQARDLS